MIYNLSSDKNCQYLKNFNAASYKEQPSCNYILDIYTCTSIMHKIQTQFWNK